MTQYTNKHLPKVSILSILEKYSTSIQKGNSFNVFNFEDKNSIFELLFENYITLENISYDIYIYKNMQTNERNIYFSRYNEEDNIEKIYKIDPDVLYFNIFKEIIK